MRRLLTFLVLNALAFSVHASGANSVFQSVIGSNRAAEQAGRLHHKLGSNGRLAGHQDPLAAELFGQVDQQVHTDTIDYIFRGQDSGGESGGGGGAGAGAAVDPSVPLTQLQLQNLFIPNSYDASGYSNQFIIQPVIPLNISKDGFIPYHIIRPTLPVIAPTANPDGPAGTQGGLGDLTLIDIFVHPMKELKTSVGAGYIAVLPTSTDRQLGLGEWQLGPSAFVITRAVPKWVIGVLYQMPFSTQSEAYAGQAQLIATRLLENEWYVGWGDQLWTVDDQNGNYNMPLQGRVGKVVKIHQQPINIFLQGFYTPDGLRKGPAAEWGIKLSVTLLFPKAKLSAPILSQLLPHGCCDCCCE